MKHYTLIMNRPESILKERFPHLSTSPLYGTPQVLVWDGPAQRKDITRLYEAIAPYCAGISLTSGKTKSTPVLNRGKWE